MSKNQECNSLRKHSKKARAPSPRTPSWEDNRQRSVDERTIGLVSNLSSEESPPSKKGKCKVDLNEMPEKAAKRVISFLGVSSLDSTNVCAVFPALACYRSEVLTEYFDAIHTQYSNNRGTGFLSPDHCRTPILSKPEESLYADIQMLKSHRRLSFSDD